MITRPGWKKPCQGHIKVGYYWNGRIGAYKRRPDKGNTGKDFSAAACNKLNMAEKYGRNVQAARLGNDRQQPETGAAASRARLLYNDFGTAPGIWLEHQDKIIILLPGPPREMEPMFTEKVLPFLPATGSVLLSRILKVTGIGEAAMEEKIADLISSQINPTIAPLARANELHLRLTAKAETKERCLELLAKTEKDLVERLGSCIYARDNETMAGVVAKMLLVQKKTLACAESCTGGLLSHKLT